MVNNMKKLLLTVLLLLMPTLMLAQNPQTSSDPIVGVNARYTNGIAPGYWPTAGSGLTLNISAGTVNCAGTEIIYAGGTLTMTASATNYVYLDTTASCAPASNTTGFASTNVMIAKVVTDAGSITTVTDDRTPFVAPNTGSGISSLNGLTAGAQTFAVGTSGTDFSISSATSTHTFNLPTASASARGALSSSDWTLFNDKPGISGTPNPGDCVTWATSNTLGDAGSGCLGGSSSDPTLTITNDGTTGTTLHSLAKLSSGAAIKTATSDTGGAIGIVTANAGTTGSATIQAIGSANCNFDGSTTAGDYVQISSSTAGDCHDAGSTYPTSGQVVGVTLGTNTGAGTYTVDLFSSEIQASSNGPATQLKFGSTTLSLGATAPTSGQYLKYDGSNIVGGTPSGSATLPFVTPESYGAKGNGAYYFDGAVAGGSLGTTGSSTSPATPASYAGFSNDVVLGIFSLMSKSWSSAPVTGTNRVNLGGATGVYGVYVNEQVISSPGAVASYGGTLSASSIWTGASVTIKCGAGCTYDGSAVNNTTSSSTINLTLPGGVANGDLLVLCVDHYNDTISGWPTGYSGPDILNQTVSSSEMECRAKTASSEPASYTITQSGTTGLTAFILAYAGGSIEGSILSSATAPFASGSVSDPICVAGATTSLTSHASQFCGTIASYISSTEVELSGQAAVATGLEFVFGSDDTSAFNSMLTACSPGGCQMGFAPKAYILTSSLSLPSNVSIQMIGSGPGVPNSMRDYKISSLSNINSGTRLVWATQSLSNPAIYAYGGSGHTSAAVNSGVYHLAMIAGAGINRDGGGNDGLSITNWQGFTASDVYVYGFSGNGVVVAADSSAEYITKVRLSQLLVSFNNGYGIYVNNGSSPNIETVKIESSEIEVNGKQGIQVTGGTAIQGLTINNDVIQRNNIAAAGTELGISTAVTGCEVYGNYFEVNTIGGSQSTDWINNHGYTGCSFGMNTLINVPIYGETLSGLFHTAGTHFTVSGCSATSPVGGISAGKFTLGANSCAAVVTLGVSTAASVAAGTGLSCFANDQTTAGVVINQTASTTTTATFAVPASAGATDVINFGCLGY